jgi:hypothetical protein
MASRNQTNPGKFQPGFALHPIQRSAALATSTKWRDALVSSVTDDGVIELVVLENDSVIRVWNYLDLTASVTPGEPVSLHSQYNVLAVGNLLLSVQAFS